MKQLQLKNSMTIGNEGLPKLKKIIFRSIPDNSARLNALMAGDIELADGINPSDGKSIEDNEKLQLFERPSMNVGYLRSYSNTSSF